MKKKVVYIFLICFCYSLFSQDIDSLKRQFFSAKNDSTKCFILSKITDNADLKDWSKYNSELFKILDYNLTKYKNDTIQKKIYLKYLGGAFANLGIYLETNGKTNEALINYENSLRIYKFINDPVLIGDSYNNIGIAFYNKGDYKKALDNYNIALTINQKTNNTYELISNLNNIGIIYAYFYDYKNAQKTFERALNEARKINDKESELIFLNNLCKIHISKGNINEALSLTNKTILLSENIDDNEKSKAYSYYNLGDINMQLKKYNAAKDDFNISKHISEKYNYINFTSSILLSIAKIDIQNKNYSDVKENLNKALDIAKLNNNREDILACYFELYNLNKNLNNENEALKFHELYVITKDSVYSEENKNAIVNSKFQVEYNSKILTDSLKTVEEKKLTTAQLKQEKTTRYALFGGLALVIIFGAFMFNRYKITQKQKQIIEIKELETQKQKHLIEEKHKEITDSINYAERIQKSFLASTTLLNENLKNYFVFFQPKDVVSGDFYWATKLNNENFALVTADSTGHGVPGAIMSLLNITSLESAIKDGCIEPSDILNATRNTIINRLKNDGSADGGKDGMDCSLIQINFKTYKLTIASANNPVWIVKNNGVDIIEIKADKMPVGKHDKDNIPFTQHEIQLNTGDIVYTLTDGFPDQFGGPKGKKFMSKNLRELLVSISQEPMGTQKQIIQTELKNWQGNLEQVDDICIIGIKI